jgi:hypothetical protein
MDPTPPIAKRTRSHGKSHYGKLRLPHIPADRMSMVYYTNCNKCNNYYLYCDCDPEKVICKGCGDDEKQCICDKPDETTWYRKCRCCGLNRYDCWCGTVTMKIPCCGRLPSKCRCDKSEVCGCCHFKEECQCEYMEKSFHKFCYKCNDDPRGCKCKKPNFLRYNCGKPGCHSSH